MTPPAGRAWVLLATVSMLGLVGSTGIAVWLRLRMEGRRLESGAATPAAAIASASPGSSPEGGRVEVFAWPAAAVQERGPGWVFELFGPPEILHDPRTGWLGVGAQRPEGTGPASGPMEFGLTLLAVEAQPFRLQLLGLVGSGANPAGVFEDLRSRQHFLGRAGQELPALGVRIDSIARSAGPNGGEKRSVATVWEHESGRAVTLPEGQRATDGTLQALVAPSDYPEDRRVLRAGESVEFDEVRYMLARVEPDPPRAEVARHAPGSAEPEVRMLHPRPEAISHDEP